MFIVHGHDGELKYKTAELLRKLGVEPIILHDQPNSCKTIIEKLKISVVKQVRLLFFLLPMMSANQFQKKNPEQEEDKMLFLRQVILWGSSEEIRPF